MPEQLASRQPVAVDQGRQAPAPLQVPSFEQSPPRALLAMQSFLGSAPPAGTGEHVPTLPATLQLMHKPPVLASLHAELQHTPSVQNLLSHWLLDVQDVPLGLSPHELSTQVLGATQSWSVWQVLSQVAVSGLQMKVPQVTVSGVRQVPRPSHVEAGVEDALVAQTGSLHWKPSPRSSQSPDLHKPVVPQLSFGVALQMPCGSGVPSRTVVQRPREADRLQAMHLSSQVELQHTPGWR